MNIHQLTRDHQICFPEGMIGHSHYHDFYLYHLDEDSPYRYLKSVNERDWYFLVIDPLWFLSEYEVKMDENERQAIDLVSDDDLQLLSLVAIPEEIELVSVNLRMPICLNRYNLRAYHKLLPEQFPVKFYIFYELNDLKKRLSQKI